MTAAVPRAALEQGSVRERCSLAKSHGGKRTEQGRLVVIEAVLEARHELHWAWKLAGKQVLSIRRSRSRNTLFTKFKREVPSFGGVAPISPIRHGLPRIWISAAPHARAEVILDRNRNRRSIHVGRAGTYRLTSRTFSHISRSYRGPWIHQNTLKRVLMYPRS